MAECHALLRDAPPVNLADVLVEAVGSLRDVDDLERLFREVEPRSAHAAEMRGDARGELGGWASPVDADSAVGAFVRACVADFAAAPFERACALAQAMDAYRREGHGEYDDAFSRVAETRKKTESSRRNAQTTSRRKRSFRTRLPRRSSARTRDGTTRKPRPSARMPRLDVATI